MTLKRQIRACISKLLIVGVLLNVAAPTVNAAKVQPGVAGLASVVPGLGQFLNGDQLESAGWFAVVVLPFLTNDPVAKQIGFGLWQYNLYDAYRDAGADDTVNHTVYVNWLANLNPLNLIDPIGAPIVGVGALLGASNSYPVLKRPNLMFMYTFVGLGEEALFRGFIYPGLTDVFGGSYWAGAITSSIVFAAAHGVADSSQLQAGVMLFRTAAGLLFSWQITRNRWDLRKNIFAHSWFDIFVSTEELPMIGASNSNEKGLAYGVSWKFVW